MNYDLKTKYYKLKEAFETIQWMARRYADGRVTYAIKEYNRAIRLAMEVEAILLPDPITDPPTIWARDANGRAYDGLSDEEATRNYRDSPYYKEIHLYDK